MNSMLIPGDTMHTFQIPAVTDDGIAAQWSVSDPTSAQLAPQTFNSLPGVMITVQGLGMSGQMTVYATEPGGACGASVLNLALFYYEAGITIELLFFLFALTYKNKREIIFKVLFFFTNFCFVKWWLCNIEIAIINKRAHVSEEEG